MRLLGGASLGAHHGRVRFGRTVTLGWLQLDTRHARRKFIDMNTHRDGGVARDVEATGQATLGVRWCGNMAATERR